MTQRLWNPSEERIKRSNMWRFMHVVNAEFGRNYSDYNGLYEWSIRNIPDFWASMWKFADIKASAQYSRVLDGPDKMPGAMWFPGARLNFAQNLLRYRDERTALIFQGEGQASRRISYARLYEETARVAALLEQAGVEPGDRVAGFMPNMPETIIAMLAATSLGAIWSSCSPDFGKKAVLDRFGQIRPKILFAADGYFYKGKRFDSLAVVRDIVSEIASIEKVVIVPYTAEKPDIGGMPNAVVWDDSMPSPPGSDIAFRQLPFEHPLYIMYSSGTTGLPKCMVQSAGGVLLNQLKELILHTDLTRDDTIFYFTTCGWMMWNWLASALGAGATLVLYDGNPFYPDPDALWKLAQDEKITVFGTSAAYLSALHNAGARPGSDFDLSSLRTVLSTGSPLSVEGFEYVYREIKEDVQLSSISGGTDLNGCFALGNPMGPVYAGELQCRGLGMKVEAWDEHGKAVTNRQGELVCTAPFPSMPICFWDDPDGKKYRAAYFSTYPNVWRHGDYIEINERGGVVIHGRSDAMLNPGGVRIGTAEIYRQVERMEEIEDSIVIGQEWKNDVRVVLFVKLAPVHMLTEELKDKIRKTIRGATTPRHVPEKILAVPEIPYTRNMKKVEIAVKQTVQKQPVPNKDALINPDALTYYANVKELEIDP